MVALQFLILNSPHEHLHDIKEEQWRNEKKMFLKKRTIQFITPSRASEGEELATKLEQLTLAWHVLDQASGTLTRQAGEENIFLPCE